VEDFCYKGKLYMNTLKFFNELEAKDILRGDKSEGLAESHPSEKCHFFIKEDTRWLEINGLTGQVRFGDSRDKDINIFCLYAVTEKNEDSLVDEGALRLGDYAAIILEGDEFLTRVKKAFEERQWAYCHDLVDYIDKNTYSGPMGPFRKYSDREFQSEFRIASKTNQQKAIDNFYIGDIRDITRLCDSKTIRNLLKIVK
jgi:hypothetical protein